MADSIDDVRVLASADAPPTARALAARRLGATSPREREPALRALLSALEDPFPVVRSEAASALGRLGDERAMPRLERRVGVEEDEGALAALLLAIGEVGARYAVPAVLPRCDDSRPRVRAAAATALGDLGGEVARQRLLALLRAPDDPDWTVRSAAMLALASCGTSADSGLVLEAYREGGGARSWLARASLGNVVAALDPAPLPILDRLLGDPDPRVASAAALALARSGRGDEVLRRLRDARAGARAAAASAAPEVAGSAQPLREAALRDPDRSVRWSAALALSRLDDPVGDALLLEGIASNDPAVSWAALAECRRKTGGDAGRDVEEWRRLLAARRGARPR